MGHFSETVRHHAGEVITSRADTLFSRPSLLKLTNEWAGQADVSRFGLGLSRVGKVESTGHVVHVDEPYGVSLVVPFRGTLTATTRGNRVSATEGEALLFAPDQRHTRVDAPERGRFLGVPIITPLQRLEDLASEQGSQRAAAMKNFSLKLSASSSAVKELLLMVQILVAEIERGAPGLLRDSARRSWEQLLNEKLLEILEAAEVLRPRGKMDSRKTQVIARQAREYIQTHFAEIATVADIAAELGVSIRSLQYAFQEAWDATPIQILKEVRLLAARAMLIDEGRDRGVTNVAFACGFSHLGRFSSDYRERFGESPSETVKRAQ